MFALAAGRFDTPSETFVRLHAERLAPGRTLLIARHGGRPESIRAPMLVYTRGEVSLTTPDGAHRPLPRRAGLLPGGLVAGVLRDFGVETLMAEFGPNGLHMLLPTRRAGVRLFTHFHGVDATKRLQSRVNRILYRRVFKWSSGIFAPSRFIADSLVQAGCPGGRITVSPCGVDPARFPLSAREAGRCLAVGRFVQKKAPGITLAAFADALREAPDLHLDFVGDGPLLEETRRLAEERGVARAVTFHGMIPHEAVQALFARASFFLQHSVTTPAGETEGLPVSVMEAMCAGLCVISTRHAGIPEAVVEGESGILVDEYDRAGMARALVELSRDPVGARELGDAARARVLERFTVDDNVATLRAAMGLDRRS